LIEDESIKTFEAVKNRFGGFVAKRKDPNKARKMVCESQKIFKTSIRGSRHEATKIGVNNVTYRGNIGSRELGKKWSSSLPLKTSQTVRERRRRVRGKSMYHVMR
jgi:hypothetical protein